VATAAAVVPGRLHIMNLPKGVELRYVRRSEIELVRLERRSEREIVTLGDRA